ncbi:hypothetical protein HDV05_007476 [Chytridiales sp. JEL 0842]|nr:hypothetical protein HDV05_007476 [Chytridiales sp. JEL 0842]
MIAKTIFLASMLASSVLAAPTLSRPISPATYSEDWAEQVLEKFLSDPAHPSASDSRQELDGINARFSCPAAGFTCKPYANDGVVPTNAKTVRPKDIATVMSIGDSITAGFAMKSGTLPFTQITEFRGSVAFIGGDAGDLTVPNYLKNYNPRVQGASTGTTALRATIDVLNAAVSGALVSDLPGQVTELVKAFNARGNTYEDDSWKMVNVLIGANNVCSSCKPNTANLHSADAFERNFRTTMQALRTNFNKTIVNAVELFDVSEVYEPQQSSSYCRFAQGILNLCECNDTAAKRAAMDALTVQYNERLRKVAAEFQFPDFVVNVQPGLRNISLQTAGLSYLSKLDCFHPSLCANQVVTNMLWNNLFQPASQKVDNYQLTDIIPAFCPGPNDYFQ